MRVALMALTCLSGVCSHASVHNSCEQTLRLGSALLPIDVLESAPVLPAPSSSGQRPSMQSRRQVGPFGVETLAIGTVALALVGIGRQARRSR